MGGVEVVTQVLANKLVEENHHVSIFIFQGSGTGSFMERLDKRIKLYQHSKYAADKKTILVLRDFILHNKVQFVINQWGLPLVPIKAVRKAVQGTKVQIISVFHNAPNANGRIQGIDTKLDQTKNPIKKCYLQCLRYAFKQVTSYAMRYNYHYSDKYLVLSESYRKVFQDFTHLRHTPKLGVMTNPITLEHADYTYKIETKRKEILFVGRLDAVQKRVDRVIETWKLIEDKYLDWQLTIVGDGADRNNLEHKATSLNLKKVSFEGFQNPLPYYQRANILLLTSDFEGYPLVLAEAMSCGVVPIVYDSFAAVHDIIDTGQDGIVVPKTDSGFSAKQMAKGIEKVIRDCENKHSMAYAAIDKSKKNSIETIYEKWIRLFHELGHK